MIERFEPPIDGAANALFVITERPSGISDGHPDGIPLPQYLRQHRPLRESVIRHIFEQVCAISICKDVDMLHGMVPSMVQQMLGLVTDLHSNGYVLGSFSLAQVIIDGHGDESWAQLIHVELPAKLALATLSVAPELRVAPHDHHGVARANPGHSTFTIQLSANI